MTSKICALGALLLGVGIILGAFGAHGLQHILEGRRQEIYEKAVLYHLINALGIIAVAICGQIGMLELRTAVSIGSILLGGIVVFCGSLYLLAVTELRWLGMITPLGGLSFIVGWGLFAWACWKSH